MTNCSILLGNPIFGRMIWNRNRLKRGSSINLISAYREKKKFFLKARPHQRDCCGAARKTSPGNSLKWAIVRVLGAFSVRLCSAVSSAAVSMAGFMSSPKMLLPPRPSLHSLLRLGSWTHRGRFLVPPHDSGFALPHGGRWEAGGGSLGVGRPAAP